MTTAHRLAPFGTTIFTEMTRLANEHGAVNLAQGFPDFDGPDFLKNAACDALRAGHNQYARMFGLPTLNTALAANWTARTGAPANPDTNITVTSGCTEALAASLLGLVNPGDEVILFEPYYDSYRAGVAMAGGVPKFVTLRPPDASRSASLCPTDAFWFDPDELKAAFTSRTRAVLVNTPHNPTGKVYSRQELALIAELCVKHNALAITDEVYEHLLFDPAQPHLHLALFPGMADRTVTLSSLGKSFSLTGWKIGWAIAAQPLTAAVRSAHQFLTFATSTPFQVAAATALTPNGPGEPAIRGLVKQLAEARTLLGDALRDIGFTVYMPAGAYFIMADHARFGYADDVEFCRALTRDIGVAAIPPSAFYEHKDAARRLARFAFCKKPETLRKAIDRLAALKK